MQIKEWEEDVAASLEERHVAEQAVEEVIARIEQVRFQQLPSPRSVKNVEKEEGRQVDNGMHECPG